ncbi:MAG: peptide chain release factor N(5)-glutamine methyltransferase [Acidobacteriota bacterium]
MTVKGAVQHGTRYLQARGLENPRHDAELIIASILDRDRAFLFAHPEFQLSSSQEKLLNEWLLKRGENYPLQYLRGVQEFYSRNFFVSPAVLIPRPETEMLVEMTLELLKEMSEDPLFVLDVGTGSGCVAVTLACEESRSILTATDVSMDALQIAFLNARKQECLDRIELLIGDALDPLAGRGPYYHLIVSNPPYIKAASRDVQPSVAKYEPAAALFAGASGLDVYDKIFQAAGQLLRSEGKLVLELGFDMSGPVRELGRGHGWGPLKIRKDLAGIDRCAVFQLV